MFLVLAFLIAETSWPLYSWMQRVAGLLPRTSVTEVWRRGLAGEGARGTPTGNSRWEEDDSGMYTGKYRDEAKIFAFVVSFTLSLEAVQPGKLGVWQHRFQPAQDLGKVSLH